MTEYCRLCAELKDSSEIVASIIDVEQSMKLQTCCEWTEQNTKLRSLPHNICGICLDKLDKSWLFSQSVASAQEKLLEMIGRQSVDSINFKCLPHTKYFHFPRREFNRNRSKAFCF